MNLLDQLNRFIAPLRQRVLSLIARAVVLEATEDGTLRRLMLGILQDEITEGVDHFQEYGFISRPLRGCEALVLHLGGDRGFGFVVATDDPRYRPLGLEPGDVVIYNDGDTLAEGEEPPEWVEVPGDGSPVQGLCRITLGRDREIRLSCAKFTVNVNGVPSEFNGETASGGVFETMAQVGRDVVVIDHGDSAGTYVIQRGAEP
jgi:phage gp45-like